MSIPDAALFCLLFTLLPALISVATPAPHPTIGLAGRTSHTLRLRLRLVKMSLPKD